MSFHDRNSHRKIRTERQKETETHRETEIQRKKDRETERDALFACGLEILLSTAMKSSTYVNHAVNET